MLEKKQRQFEHPCTIPNKTTCAGFSFLTFFYFISVTQKYSKIANFYTSEVYEGKYTVIRIWSSSIELKNFLWAVQTFWTPKWLLTKMCVYPWVCDRVIFQFWMQEKKHKHKFQGSAKKIFCVIEHILHGSFMIYAYQTVLTCEKQQVFFFFLWFHTTKRKKPSWPWTTKIFCALTMNHKIFLCPHHEPQNIFFLPCKKKKSQNITLVCECVTQKRPHFYV